MEKNTVTLIGLEWDKENIDGHYYFHEANKVAEDNGKRLPTKEEFEKLSKLPRIWDEERNGMWFAEKKKDLKNPDKSLFLPVTGYRNNSDGDIYNEMIGYYWSSTARNDVYGYNIGFNAGDVSPSGNSYYTYGFCVRCVSK
jgi:uncharacterized protein (TIGR02145 family)